MFWRTKICTTIFFKIKDSFPFKQVQNNFDKIQDVLSKKINHENIVFDQLIVKYKRFYDNEIIKINFNISTELYFKIRRQEEELNKLLQEVIIGNNDIDIAEMINNLGISNWVSTGISFLEVDKDLQNALFVKKKLSMVNWLRSLKIILTKILKIKYHN